MLGGRQFEAKSCYSFLDNLSFQMGGPASGRADVTLLCFSFRNIWKHVGGAAAAGGAPLVQLMTISPGPWISQWNNLLHHEIRGRMRAKWAGLFIKIPAAVVTQPILVMESPGHPKMETAIFQPLPSHTHILYINYPEHLQVFVCVWVWGGGRCSQRNAARSSASVGKAQIQRRSINGVQKENRKES